MGPSIKPRFLRIYPGWWMLFVTGIFSGLGHGFYVYGISIFFKDISTELGINRAMTSLAAGIGRLEGGITSPLVGWLCDRFGPKWIVFTGVCLAGLGMILMNYISSLWEYTIVWGVFIGVGLNIGLTVAVDKALNDWFIFKRGLAQGTKFALIGIGCALVLPVVTYLVTAFGWRITCILWGSVMLVFSPLLLLFVKQKPPEFYGLLPDGRPHKKNLDDGIGKSAKNIKSSRTDQNTYQEFNFTFRQAIRTRAYWYIAVAFGLVMFISGVLHIHMIPFLTDLGISRTRSGTLMGMMLFFTIPSRFFAGLLSDRVPQKKQHLLLAGFLFVQSISLVVLVFGQEQFITAFLVLFGISNGAVTPLFILLIGSYFGRTSFGMIFGSSMAIRAPVSLVAPVLAGWIFDQSGSYLLAFKLVLICSILALVFMLVLPEPKQ